MQKENFDKYLKERYFDQLNWYDKKAAENQRKYKVLQGLIIILSAITPIAILAGGIFNSFAVFTSTLVAIFTSIIGAFKYHENWVSYRTTCETLKKEYYYYQMKANAYKIASDPETLFVDRVEEVISRENTLWVNTQTYEKKKGGR